MAGKELAELDRWRVGSTQARQWLSESEAVTLTLDHVASVAIGISSYGHIRCVRDELRETIARDEAKVIRLTPAELQSGLDRVRHAEGLIRQLPEDHDGRNSWLLNYARDRKVESRGGR